MRKGIKHIYVSIKTEVAVTITIFIIFSIITALPIYAQTFQYDQCNRLRNIQFENGSSITYTYDQIGNRTSQQIILNPNTPFANLKAFLEGCYSNGQLLTSLASGGFISESQPYNVPPWNYNGAETVDTIAPNIVDWVLIELRTGLLSGTKISTRAALLKNDGSIVDNDGTSQVRFVGVEPGAYYIVLRHRNHLDIMSGTAIPISPNSELYDFTDSQTMAYTTGPDPMNDLGDGKFGMIAGDADADGVVDYEDDLLIKWIPNFGLDGYYPADFNMNGTVDYEDDVLQLWLSNFGYSSQVPGAVPNTKKLELKINIKENKQ